MDKSTDNEKKRRRQAVVDELKSIGVKGGVLRTYREEGRGFPAHGPQLRLEPHG